MPKIQFRFDNLESRPRLSVAAHPTAVAVTDLGDGPVAAPVRFRMYANYAGFIQRAEIRVFDHAQSLQAAPLAIVAVDSAGLAEWQPARSTSAGRSTNSSTCCAPTMPRAISTRPKRSRCGCSTNRVAPAVARVALNRWKTSRSRRQQRRRLPASCWLPMARAGSRSTTFRWAVARSRCRAAAFPPNHSVWVAGRQVPVDTKGNFAAEEILPSGAHTVEVAVLDDAGNGSLYLRDLEFKRNDWFYVGLADLTVVRSPHQRAGRPAAGRKRAPRLRFARWTAGWRST